MNFFWTEIEFIQMNIHAVRMKFIWNSHGRTNEVDMLYPCNTNEVDMRLINSSHGIHMKFIWSSNDLNFIWTSCELHKNYMTNTQEIPSHYTWIWFLASLLCTSYEWASRSIVAMYTFFRPQSNRLKLYIGVMRVIIFMTAIIYSNVDLMNSKFNNIDSFSAYTSVHLHAPCQPVSKDARMCRFATAAYTTQWGSQ